MRAWRPLNNISIRLSCIIVVTIIRDNAYYDCYLYILVSSTLRLLFKHFFFLLLHRLQFSYTENTPNVGVPLLSYRVMDHLISPILILIFHIARLRSTFHTPRLYTIPKPPNGVSKTNDIRVLANKYLRLITVTVRRFRNDRLRLLKSFLNNSARFRFNYSLNEIDVPKAPLG